MMNIGINGLGRIGRLVIRDFFGGTIRKFDTPNSNIIHVNDIINAIYTIIKHNVKSGTYCLKNHKNIYIIDSSVFNFKSNKY